LVNRSPVQLACLTATQSSWVIQLTQCFAPGLATWRLHQRVCRSTYEKDDKAADMEPHNACASAQNRGDPTPGVSPDEGIAIYSHDPTQGPACAIACAAGTVYRNYFVELDGQLGQSSGSQVDCLADVGRSLGNADGRSWKMQNGYALPTRKGLQEIDDKLSQMSESELDELRGRLKIGLQWDTQVTLSSKYLIAFSAISP
jgi:hypothetical protein